MTSGSGPGNTLSGEETLGGTFGTEPLSPATAVLPGDRIGRYVVLREVGRGAMGEVVAAYDPELDRQIALKLLAAGRGGEAEAKAMAQLSHPNVITVHDVSEFRGRPLIAMELVEGTTLAAWLETKPTVAQVVDAFVQAGRGLAAAHEAGIVHRDFKPANVLVEVTPKTGGARRVRVGDFGLAVNPTDLEDGDDDGAVVGTPQYMAPEQFSRGPVSALADQFSFCLALYEGVYAEAPFAGSTPMSRARAVLEGDRRPIPNRSGVPLRVRRTLDKGLSIDPQHRFASMEALLAELTPSPHRRHWMLTAALVGVAGLGGLAIAPDAPPPGCEPDAGLSISPRRRDAARASLQAHGLAESAWSEIEPTLQMLEQMNSDTRLHACSAHEAGELEEEALFTQLHCLALAEAELDALVRIWEDADDSTAEVAASALDSLSWTPCAQGDQQRGSYRDLDDDQLQFFIEARANGLALRASNLPREAIAVIDTTKPESMSPSRIAADLLRLRGLARRDLGDLDGGEEDLWRSLAIATAANANDAAALAWSWLIKLESEERDRPQVALLWRHVAEAHAGDDPFLLAQLQNHLGGAWFRLQKIDDAEEAFRRSLEYWRRLPLPRPQDEASVVNNLGSISAVRGDLERAEKQWQESVARYREASGIPTKSILRPLTNLARLHTIQGHVDQADAARRECLEVARDLSRSSPLISAETAGTTAGLFEFEGLYRDAHAAASEALTFIVGSQEVDRAVVTGWQIELARYFRESHPLASANPALEEALASVQAGIDVPPLYIGRALATEAEWTFARGDLPGARVLAERLALFLVPGRPFPSGRLLRIQVRLLAEQDGPRAALDRLDSSDIRAEDNVIVGATQAELLLQLGEVEKARRAARLAAEQLDEEPRLAATTCSVRATLVRVTMPDPDPRDVEAAAEACNTDPPRPEAAMLEGLAELEEP